MASNYLSHELGRTDKFGLNTPNNLTYSVNNNIHILKVTFSLQYYTPILLFNCISYALLAPYVDDAIRNACGAHTRLELATSDNTNLCLQIQQFKDNE